MKIGILTQPLASNYGGILQNYALQLTLKRMGHFVVTFDIGKHRWIDWCVSSIKTVIKKMLGRNVKFQPSPRCLSKREKPLRKFVYQNINISRPRRKCINLEIVKKYKVNTIIVGSDQVWRPCYNTNIGNMFLDFTEGINIKRIAYAASFGTDNWEFNSKQEELCSKLAQRFDAVSVREQSAVGLCKKHLGINSTFVLDPTLLLNSDDYTNLCVNIKKREPFIFAYILDQNEDKISTVREFAKFKGLPFYVKGSDSEVDNDDSIESWLSFFRDASYVITDSFHGTVFSIIFNKDFWVFENAKRGNSRFESLLNLFNLNDRIILDSIPKFEPIRWNDVNLLVKHNRQMSKDWLKYNL